MLDAAWNSDGFLVLVVAIALLVLVAKRFAATRRSRERAKLENNEANRMLGLAFHQQGQLDLAFDKLRRAPLDSEVMEHLYALALDFERRREPDKAEAVLRHMATHDPGFRDLQERLAKLSRVVDAGCMPAAPASGRSIVLAGEGMEKPVLGRYEVECELGKGAMGTVYRGRDPATGRSVAIKTVPLSSRFEAAELDRVKQRFFREAETAGRLTHPHIVRIHDAGELNDLCYIAMELVDGSDLVPHTRQPNLLPPAKVLSIVERVADALGYAHAMGVLHRDVKPANIMYAPETDTVKVTDFGIARITDSSRTRTGTALGTPSYMSPEQLAGRRTDGRSDLFSLGVTLYQLLSGHLPFEGESMTRLMSAIANDRHTPVRQHNPALPASIDAIVDRALAKEPEQRFQTGSELAEAIRQARRNTTAAADAAA